MGNIPHFLINLAVYYLLSNGLLRTYLRTGGSLSVTESPKVTAEEERVEAAPTKDTDISGLRELG